MSLERLVYSTVTEQYNSLRKIEDKAAGIVSNFTPFPPREVLFQKQDQHIMSPQKQLKYY